MLHLDLFQFSSSFWTLLTIYVSLHIKNRSFSTQKWLDCQSLQRTPCESCSWQRKEIGFAIVAGSDTMVIKFLSLLYEKWLCIFLVNGIAGACKKKIYLIIMNVCRTPKFWFTFHFWLNIHLCAQLDFTSPPTPTSLFPYPLNSFWSELLIPSNIFRVSLWVNIPSRTFLLNGPSLSHKEHSWCFFRHPVSLHTLTEQLWGFSGSNFLGFVAQSANPNLEYRHLFAC